MAKIIVAPSILAADMTKLGEQVKTVEKAGAKYLHVDIMDGHFVPNLSFGPAVLKAVRGISDMVMDVHLMLENPIDYIDAFAKAGADIITVHTESKSDVSKCIEKIHSHGIKAGVVINPDTDYTAVLPYKDMVEMVLVMSVYPGFGGQKFISSVLEKTKKLREILPENVDIEIDGGIGLANYRDAIDAGVNVLVAGSSVFGADDIAQVVGEMLS